MCILAVVTRYCDRFPFILVGNRDEVLARATGTLAHDPVTGLVWAVDRLAGGSWMGIEPRSGRFAILTNCRRPPEAPLRLRLHDSLGCAAPPVDAETWRGAAPLSDIIAHTAVIPVPTAAAAHDPQERQQGRAVTLNYNPPTSRGTVIKDFLCNGSVPGDGCDAAAAVPGLPDVVRCPPYYAGFNLLTCDDLRTAPTLAYTANRYGAEHRSPVAHGVVHALQNSFLDNTDAEPITDRLRQLFTDALAHVIDPLVAAEAAAGAGGGGALAPDAVTDVATALVDACLCDRCNFDVPKIAAESAAVQAQLHATSPLLGFTAAELQRLFGHEQRRRAARVLGGWGGAAGGVPASKHLQGSAGWARDTGAVDGARGAGGCIRHGDDSLLSARRDVRCSGGAGRGGPMDGLPHSPRRQLRVRCRGGVTS